MGLFLIVILSAVIGMICANPGWALFVLIAIDFIIKYERSEK